MSQIQYSFFYDFQLLIQNSNFYRKYHLLFQSLDLSKGRDKNYSVGRTGYSRFLSDTNNSTLQDLHHKTIKDLFDKDLISKDILIVDSKPVMAATRENNFKNPKRNVRDKNRKAKHNPSATLGYYSYQAISGKKDKFIFFWGYRTHVIVSKEGIPLVELTLSNNIKDSAATRKLIKKLKRVYASRKGSILLADAAYDERAFYNFIVDKLKWQGLIPINPRGNKPINLLVPMAGHYAMPALKCLITEHGRKTSEHVKSSVAH